MFSFQTMKKTFVHKIFSVFLSLIFPLSFIIPSPAFAQSFLNLPPPGSMITLSQPFTPPLIKGIILHPDNPLNFSFIISKGDENIEGRAFKNEATKLIKYFLASLTIPEKDLWVNLSPYEKDRIIPKSFGLTEMGRDLLAQDYILKQLTASLIYPEKNLGKEFWDKVYKKAYELYGTTEIPVNTFNKIWIVPEKAVIFQHGASAFVAESSLKVMLEEDYLAMQKSMGDKERGLDKMGEDDARKVSNFSSQVVREVLIPAIEKEVNEGKNFANLRQIYNAMILATWYKQNLRESLLGKVYVDQAKVKGVDLKDPTAKEKIYQQYVAAIKKGVFHFIKEDYDKYTNEVIPRKYFSGGFDGQKLPEVTAVIERGDNLTPEQKNNLQAFGKDAEEVQVTLVENTDTPLPVLPEAQPAKTKNTENEAPIISGDNMMLADASGKPMDLQVSVNQEELTKTLEQIIQKDRQQFPNDSLENMIKEYHMRKGRGLSTDAIEAMVDQRINSLNAFRKVPIKNLQPAKIPFLDDFLEQQDVNVYREKAKNYFLMGKYIPHFLFAGAATRLNRGPMYPLDIWDILQEKGMTQGGDTLLPIGMGPRQLIAYRLALEKLAKESGEDIHEVLARQKMIFAINEDVAADILQDFLANDFYGFNPENIYFIVQPTLPGYEFKGRELRVKEKGKELPYGHGYNAMQFNQPGQAFHLTRDGRQEFLTDSVLDELEPDALIASHRINDLIRFSSEKVIDVDKLAYTLYAMDQGYNYVEELVSNPGRQKGGNAFQDKTTGKVFLLETSNTKGSPGLTRKIEESAKKGAPYNSFRAIRSVSAQKEILQRALPYNLRFKNGNLYLEAVTGDMTQMTATNAFFFTKKGEVIHDFKAEKNLEEARKFLRQEDRTLLEKSPFWLQPLIVNNKARKFMEQTTAQTGWELSALGLRGAYQKVLDIVNDTQRTNEGKWQELSYLFTELYQRTQKAEIEDALGYIAQKEPTSEVTKEDLKVMKKAIKDTADALAKRVFERMAKRLGVVLMVRVSEGFGRDEVAESLKANEVVAPEELKGEMDRIYDVLQSKALYYKSLDGQIYPIIDAIIDVIEGTNQFVTNSGNKTLRSIPNYESGSTSVIVTGLGVRDLGNAPDGYVGQFITNLGSREMAEKFNRRTVTITENGNPVEFLLKDPELYARHPYEGALAYLRFLAEFRGQELSGVEEEIVVMDRDRETDFLSALNEIKNEFGIKGLKITTIKDGTVAHGLKATLTKEIYEKITGHPYGFHKTVITIGGAPEGFMNLAVVGGAKNIGAVGAVRIYSGKMNKDAAGNVMKDKSQRYAFTEKEQNEMRNLRPDDADAILAGKKLFTEEDVKHPVIGRFSFISTNGVFHQKGAKITDKGYTIHILKIDGGINYFSADIATAEGKTTKTTLASPVYEGDNMMLGEIVPLENTGVRIKFGTSGWRGKIGKDFTVANVRRAAQGTVEYMLKYEPGKELVLGYDTREGNEGLIKEVASIAVANGIKVKIVANEPTPTPVLAYLAASDEKVGGVVNLTASHNPYTDDGFKFSPGHGGAADKTVTDAITKFANEAKTYRTMGYQEAVDRGLIVELSQQKVMQKYMDQYLIPTLKKLGAWDDIVNYIQQHSDFELVLDPMQGTGVDYLKYLYSQLAEDAGRDFFTMIHTNNKDTRFSEVGGGPRPDVSASNKGLREAIEAKNGKAMGLAVDGDADRFGTVDFDGKFVGANDLIALMAYFLKKDIGLSGKIGKTVGTSNFVNAVAEYLGEEVVETAVGFKHFVKKVEEGADFLIAGEESAHVGLQPFMKTWDDGIAVGITTLWMVAKTGKSLARYKEEIENTIGRYYEIKADEVVGEDDSIKEPAKQKIAKTLEELDQGIPQKELSVVKEAESLPVLQGQKVKDVITLDGVKLVFESGDWLLFRPSGTQPAVKFYAETSDRRVRSADTLLQAARQLAGIETIPETEGDNMMLYEDDSTPLSEAPTNVGGIDLNPASLDLQIRRDDNGVPLPLFEQPIENMHIEGFFPVIINIQPVTNLPMLLGLTDEGAPSGVGYNKEEGIGELSRL